MTSRKILMLGWEFPPKITGGLGVASQGLAEAMAKSGHEVSFLLPKKHKSQVSKEVKLIDASVLKPDLNYWKKKKKIVEILTEVEMGMKLIPYLGYETFEIALQKQQEVEIVENSEETDLLENIQLTGTYEANLGLELVKYALLSVQVAKKQKPELIHAHDWITFRAGIFIKKALKLPLFVHVHSTEYDRNGVNAQQFVIDEEKAGFKASNHIFCVSQKLKHTIVSNYGINENKVTVVPNALSHNITDKEPSKKPRTLAFVGRLTDQKSPTTFIDLARELYSRGYDFEYLIIGDGHLRPWLEEKVNGSNYGKKVSFLGFLERSKLMQKLNEVDLLVMPSASEPFGLVALEAVLKKIPVAAAIGSGVSEVIPSIPQVNRWDHFNYMRLIVSLMTNLDYREQITEACAREASKLTWENSIIKIEKAYKSA